MGVDVGVERSQIFLEPLFAPSNVRGPGIVGSVGKPEHDVAAVQSPRDADAILRVLERMLAHARVWIAEGAELVDLFFEQVWVDGARLDAVPRRQRGDPVDVVHAVGEVPQDMQRQGGTDAGQPVHLLRV